MHTDDPEVAQIAGLLSTRLGALAPQVAAAIRREIDFYATSSVLSEAEIVETVRANFEYVLAGMRGAEFDTSPAVTTGRSRAEMGVPLSAVMHAYRIGFHLMWRQVRALADEHTELGRSALLRATELMWLAQDRYMTAMAGAHRERSTQMVLDAEAERAALTEHLLQGAVSSEQSLWEIAELLRLPRSGPYLTVAARVTAVGRVPLPEIRSRLGGLGVYSAWRLLPDQQIGIVHVPSSQVGADVVALLRRIAADGGVRIGVSAPFAELVDTARALRRARVALASRGAGVSVFDDSVLGVAAAGGQDVGAELTSAVLGPLYRLPADEAAPLFDTFRAWVRHDGNVTATAAELYVHPNTVRHRLRRIAESTGRSTTRPRDVAELCLAFEADALLPSDAR